ncbi:hypothetical protein [Arsenicicoccus piscis]|uniref:Two-component sensor histidine kinase n=1 Tax=Arsenicicoccus piscis TaxID=673954 RepID=A0ABQ6HT27_9MICO|nr:hypothetical protein [Arsenicicoccus piscis]GMA21137.1 hypothetical protein GCM10025862_31580 [Arsenicicoccus piscis]
MSPSSWSLTTKLIASVVALFIAVTVAIAGATVVTMNHVLEGQVAQQLQGQTRRISDEANGIGSGRGGRGFDECSAPTSNSLPPNSGDGVVRLCVTGDQILTAYSLKERTVSSLDADQVATLTGAGVTGQPAPSTSGATSADIWCRPTPFACWRPTRPPARARSRP